MRPSDIKRRLAKRKYKPIIAYFLQETDPKQGQVSVPVLITKLDHYGGVNRAHITVGRRASNKGTEHLVLCHRLRAKRGDQ